MTTNPTIDALTIGGDASVGLVGDGALTLVGAGLANDGALVLEGGVVTPASLIFGGAPSIIAGAGTVIGTEGLNRICALTPGDTLVHGAAHSIRGRVEVGADSLRLVNHGLIEGPSSGTMTVDLFDGAVSENFGTLRAIGNGTLLIRDSTLDNAGGVIESIGGTVAIRDAHLAGGLLRDGDGDGPGALRITGASSLDSVELDGTLLIDSYALVTLGGASQVPSLAFTTSTPAGYGILELLDPVTELPPGTVWTGTNTASNSIRGAPGAVRTIHVRRGAAIHGGIDVGLKTLRIDNDGLIEASQAVGLRLSASDSVESRNTGVIRAAAGTILKFFGGIYDNHGGVIEAAPSGTVHFGPASGPGGSGGSQWITIRGGTLRAVGDPVGVIGVVDALVLEEGVVVEGEIVAGPDNGGSGTYRALVIGAGATVPAQVRLGGYTPTNIGGQMYCALPEFLIDACVVTGNPQVFSDFSHGNTISGEQVPPTHCTIGPKAVLSGSHRFRFYGGSDNHGLIECEAPAKLQLDLPNSFFVNHPDGVIRLTGTAPAQLDNAWYSKFENRGTVVVHPPRKVFTANVLTQSDGVFALHALLQFGGGTSRLHVTGGRFEGAGTVDGPVESTGGVIAPESVDGSAATLTFTKTFVQATNGMLEVDLGGATDAGVEPGDRLVVIGPATLGGTLHVRTSDGFIPLPRDSFVVLTAASITGAFESIDSCLPVHVEYSPTTVTVVFDPAIEGDLSGDGHVDGGDLTVALGAWGPCTDDCCAADLNGDGLVDGADLTVILGAWSP